MVSEIVVVAIHGQYTEQAGTQVTTEAAPRPEPPPDGGGGAPKGVRSGGGNWLRRRPRLFPPAGRRGAPATVARPGATIRICPPTRRRPRPSRSSRCRALGPTAPATARPGAS